MAMMLITRKRHLVVPIMSAAAALLACQSAEPSDTAELETASIEETSQELFVGAATDLWSSAVKIPICFQPSQDIWDNQRAAYDAQKLRVRAWIEGAMRRCPT